MYEDVCETGVDINGFKGEEFFDPQNFVSFKNKINVCLALASHASSQAVLHWSRFRDGFGALCEQGLEKAINRFDPGIIIFFVSSADQAVAAQTMANYIKSGYPGVQVLALTKIRLDFLYPQYFDHLILNQGRKGLVPLIDFLNKAHGININPQNILPDFRGMHLEQYLIPEKVVLVHPLFFKDPVLLSEFLEDQVRNLGVQGFVFVHGSGGADGGRVPAGQKAPDQAKGGDCFMGIYRHLAHWLSIKQAHVFFSIQIPMKEPISGNENKLSDLFSSGLRLILWEEDTNLSEKILWKASKLGIWNHLIVRDLFREQGNNGQGGSAPAKFIVNNPNIVHSFQNTDQDTNQGIGQDLIQGEAAKNILSKFMDYAKVQPLPGIPFWNFLGNPSYLLVYLSQLTKKSLACLRADLTNNSIISLGSQMTFFYQSPKEIPPGVLDEICKMVEAGGSVDITHVRFNLEKAYLIGYAMENGVIIGNSSLKHPRQIFIKRLKQMTGVDFTNFVERGYTSVRPEYRAMGVGAKLLEGLTKRAKDYKVFSIISEDNLATQKIALRNNTKKILTYFSEKLNKEMGVWMPEVMIDNSVDIERG